MKFSLGRLNSNVFGGDLLNVASKYSSQALELRGDDVQMIAGYELDFKLCCQIPPNCCWISGEERIFSSRVTLRRP
jgi:hypothetical protein